MYELSYNIPDLFIDVNIDGVVTTYTHELKNNWNYIKMDELKLFEPKLKIKVLNKGLTPCLPA